MCTQTFDLLWLLAQRCVRDDKQIDV